METSLSAGLYIYDALVENGILDKVNAVFPVYTKQDLQLPYIMYRCESSSQAATKSGQTGSDATHVSVVCYAATYKEAVELGEEVRSILDYSQRERESGKMRVCCMSDSEDGYDDEAFYKRLVFTVKI